MNDNKFTTEIFNNRTTAEKAYNDAIARGYKPDEINVLMSEDSKKKYYGTLLVTESDKSMEGLGVGGATGGAVVGILAAIAAIGTSLVIPGLGLVVAGPLAAGLAGAGAGSIAGGLIGALIGWGIPEDRAEIYEKGLKSGGIVLGVKEHPQRPIESDWRKYSYEHY
jgi:hypothetical protein